MTLLIAGGGLVLGVKAFRADTRVGIRVEVALVNDLGADPAVAVVLTNTQRRAVSVERVGLVLQRRTDGAVFETWNRKNLRMGRSMIMTLSDPPLPLTLEPGGRPDSVTAGVRSLKGFFHPELPSWAFCVDIYRNVYWGRVPEDARAALSAARRRVWGPEDEYGQPTRVEVDDAAIVAPDKLAD